MINRFILGIAILAAGCSSKTADRYETREGNLFDAILGASPYQRLFISKTVTRRIQSEFEGILNADITPWDQELREAYVKEMRNQYRLPEGKELKLATEQLQENEAYIVYIVSVSTRESIWNDLDKTNSLWRVVLESEGTAIQEDPERIEVVPQYNEMWRYFYPTMTTFTRTYRVRFNRKPFKDSVNTVLRISGVKGSISADFKNKV